MRQFTPNEMHNFFRFPPVGVIPHQFIWSLFDLGRSADAPSLAVDLSIVSRCKRHHPIQCFISYGGRSVVPFTRVSHYGTLKSFTMRKMLLDRKNHLSHMFSAQSTPFHQVSSISDMLRYCEDQLEKHPKLSKLSKLQSYSVPPRGGPQRAP